MQNLIIITEVFYSDSFWYLLIIYNYLLINLSVKMEFSSIIIMLQIDSTDNNSSSSQSLSTISHVYVVCLIVFYVRCLFFLKAQKITHKLVWRIQWNCNYQHGISCFRLHFFSFFLFLFWNVSDFDLMFHLIFIISTIWFTQWRKNK